MEKNAIVVFTANTARRLLKMGYTIIDIKPDKKDLDGKKSLFVFRIEDGIMDVINEMK